MRASLFALMSLLTATTAVAQSPAPAADPGRIDIGTVIADVTVNDSAGPVTFTPPKLQRPSSSSSQPAAPSPTPTTAG